MTADTSNSNDRSRQIDAAIAEYLEAMEHGTPLDREEFLLRYPELQEFLADHSALKQQAQQYGPGNQATAELSNIHECAGAVIGPYKLLEQIGEGGMGVVYMADQQKPVRRRVALKIIKPGMDTRQVIARFEAERQALALMDHVNIARVLDAGTTDSGRPYFVMELVRGISITQYCDRHRLSVRQRLELFVEVCQAVQHAHQKGIIHRDLKPSNVLVTVNDGRPVPKVIDFGVAKATNQQLTEKTLFTAFAQMIGTPLYMSPEQAELTSLDIDTRSDIYSLGVLLYELLTGTTPFDRQRLSAAAYNEMVRIIREEEPPKPSTRLSSSDALPSIAANRGSEPLKLNRLVRGELDWIVMKALDKDRNRRYATANGFAADIQHYLRDEAVQACPPSAAYRFRKLTRRHKAAFFTTGIVAASLVLATAISIWEATLARRAEGLAQNRLLAEREAHQQATAISELLQKALQSANPEEAKGANYTVRELFDELSAGLGDQFKDHPENSAAIQAIIGNVYRGLGLLDKAEPHLKTALDLRKQIFGPIDVHVAQSLSDYAWCLIERRDTKDRVEAEELVRKALKIHQQLGLHNLTTAKFFGQLQLILSAQRPTKESYQAGQDALEIAGDEQLPEVANLLHRLAENLLRQDEPDPVQAEALARRAVALHRKLHGESHPQTGWGLYTLGCALDDQGKYADAEKFFREALTVFLKQFNDSHVTVQKVLGRLEGMLTKVNDQAGLMALRAERAARIKERMQHDPTDALLQLAGAEAICATGDLDGAIAVLDDVIGQHPELAKAWKDRGSCYGRKGEYAKAVDDYSHAIHLNARDSWGYIQRGYAYLALAEQEKAIADFSSAIDLDERDARLWYQRAGCYCQLNQWDKADADLVKAMELSPERPEMPSDRALVRMALNDEAGYRQACAAIVERAEHSPNVNFARSVGVCTYRPGAVDDPMKVVALAERNCKGAPHDPWSITVRGAALYRASRFEEARQALNDAVVAYQQSDSHAGVVCYDYLFLAMVHQRLNQPDEAHSWLNRAVQIIDEPRSASQQHPDIDTWDDQLCLSTLRKEAEQVLADAK